MVANEEFPLGDLKQPKKISKSWWCKNLGKGTTQAQAISRSIHVWNIYLHVGQIYGVCRQIFQSHGSYGGMTVEISSDVHDALVNKHSWKMHCKNQLVYMISYFKMRTLETILPCQFARGYHFFLRLYPWHPNTSVPKHQTSGGMTGCILVIVSTNYPPWN